MSRRTLQFASHRFARRLRFEPLEDRRVLATFTVTNLGDAPVTGSDSAPGTLRQAIYDANSLPDADLIEFASDLSGSVALSVVDDTTSGASALVVTSPITIRGNSNGITISRDGSAAEMRLFRVAATGDFILDTLSLTGGIVRGTNGTGSEFGGDIQGGAVLNLGTLQIVSSTLYANQAIGGNGGTSGSSGIGLGGAIYNENSIVSIMNSTFSGNAVLSGTGSNFRSSFGGAVYTHNGTITVRNSTITNSTASTGRGIYVLADGVATVDMQSTIIGQSDIHPQVREFLTALDGNGQLFITGSDNLIRSQGDFQFITVSTDDPLLAQLASNGGPTLTHALTTNSPALNLGNNSQSLAADQRGGGYSRVFGIAADIGAFELQTAVAPELPGDYNGSHIVDGADYVLWRKTRDMTVPQYSGADGNGNGVVDDADYDVWRMHFGETPPPAAAASFAGEGASLGSCGGSRTSTLAGPYVIGVIPRCP